MANDPLSVHTSCDDTGVELVSCPGIESIAVQTHRQNNDIII
jgi:hypothetical protein